MSQEDANGLRRVQFAMISRRSFLGASLTVATLGANAPLAFAQKDAAPVPLRLTFDTAAVSRLLDLQAAKDDSDAAVAALLALPAYLTVIRVGEAEGSLTREGLARNAKAVIRSEATPRSQPREDAARLLVNNPESYRVLLKDLAESGAARSARIAAHLARFTPDTVRKGAPIAQTVYLHLGGTWDALNVQGDVFLNLHYWAEYNRPALDGLNLVVAHETLHTIQTRAFGNPERQDTGAGAFFTALSKIQREGTARYAEENTDPEPYAPYTYGFFYRAIDNETVRDFARLPRLLEPLHAACFPVFDRERFVELYSRGMNNGGDFYALGHGVAKAIDDRAGRAALVETVAGGPQVFWSRYVALQKKHAALPRLPDAVTARIANAETFR